MAAAVPFAIKAGAMIGGSLLGKKLSGASKDQKTAMTGTQQSATALQNASAPLLAQGSNLTRMGTNYLGQAGSYYGNILSNRRAASASLAPEMKTAMDYYAGAAGKASRTLRGGSRDYALAELDRAKVGNMAMMLPQARASAAEGVSRLGNEALGSGASLYGTGGNMASNAAYVNSGLFNQASQIGQQQNAGGKAWGGLLYDLAGSLFKGKKKAGGASGALPFAASIFGGDDDES